MRKYCKIKSPVGLIIFSFDERHVFSITFRKQTDASTLQTDYADPSKSPVSKLVQTQINEYFNLKRRCFSLPTKLEGTNFQIEVWAQLNKITYGSTASYSNIAQSIGKKNSVRAVANAIGRNPISIVIPCHRIIGKNGTLTGYSGGLAVKSALLRLESKTNQ